VPASLTEEGWEFAGEDLDPAMNVVADEADGFDSMTCGVVELPVEMGLAGEYGQTSPQAMVLTTVDASDASGSVSSGRRV
jgi:hypothetical protein